MIILPCDTCERRTDHDRQQWTETDPPRIVTEHTCTECGTIESETQKYTTDE